MQNNLNFVMFSPLILNTLPIVQTWKCFNTNEVILASRLKCSYSCDDKRSLYSTGIVHLFTKRPQNKLNLPGLQSLNP